MNKLILSTAILALTAGAALAESHGSTVRIGTEGAYPPYNFLNDAGEVDGFRARSWATSFASRAELTCEWVTNDWDSIIPNLVSGNYDAIMAGMSVTDERKEVIAFSEQYTLPDPSSFLVMDDAADLATGVIAAQAGTIQAAYVASSGATLLEFATPDESVAAVKNGEADAVLADKSFLAPLAEADGELSLVAQDVMIGGGIGIGLRQSDEELKTKFDAAIISMKEDGSLNALIAKWLPDAGQFE